MAIVELYLNTYKSLEPFALMLIEAGLDDDQTVKDYLAYKQGYELALQELKTMNEGK